TLQPIENILPEIRLVIVDEYRCGDVHRRNEHHAVDDVGLRAALLDVVGDVDDLLAALRVEGEIVRVRLHEESRGRAAEGGWGTAPPVCFSTKPSSGYARKRCQ